MITEIYIDGISLPDLNLPPLEEDTHSLSLTFSNEKYRDLFCSQFPI